MERTRDEICNQIANDIEEMDSFEKEFALWYLLREYYEKELRGIEEPKTVEEYKNMVFRRDVSVAVNHLIEILGFDMWG